jgi:anti-anti-sigma factor
MSEGFENDHYFVRQFDDITIVRLKDESLTGSLETMQISDQLKQMVEEGTRKLVLDLKHVRFCGSAGLGMLIGLNKKLQAAGGQFVLSHTEHIDQLLEISWTAKLFRIAADPKEALGMFK